LITNKSKRYPSCRIRLHLTTCRCYIEIQHIHSGSELIIKKIDRREYVYEQRDKHMSQFSLLTRI
jgi:hypothetical protein